MPTPLEAHAAAKLAPDRSPQAGSSTLSNLCLLHLGTISLGLVVRFYATLTATMNARPAIGGGEGTQLMASDLQNALAYAHQANIDRYRKLLKTHLADHERQFIQQQLGEEEDALLEMDQRTAQLDCPNAAWTNPAM